MSEAPQPPSGRKSGGRRVGGQAGAQPASGRGGSGSQPASGRGGSGSQPASRRGGAGSQSGSRRGGSQSGSRGGRGRDTGAAGGHRHRTAAEPDTAGDGAYRAGFACFVGRPNAGKSTLTNAIIGQKIAITSNKPQTTRHIIRGVLHRPDGQLVLVDTPGLHRPRTLLGQRLNDLVRDTWSEVDVIGVCFPADEPVGAGDRFISAEIAELKATVIAVVTKVDLVDPATLAQRLIAVSELYDFAEIVPVSAVSGHQVDTLVEVLVRHLPESPQLYPDDVLTEEPEQVLVAELVREAALEGVRDELPHSIAVLVQEMLVEGNLTKVYADVYVERDSQKSIVIGTRGSRLKDVGTRARAQIEALLGTKVYLDLHVRVAKEWQRDPKQLRRLGF
ncbi:GTP-binding protein Era [Krasilnikovia cinnamomea]|uniref:GTPase Era n=1 Tax=Krasilnikovia cinnamomea TaxID=349313 RepID=A0A4Q7ZNJ5_9ACTN|nr:GTP-binding protein Era [Krasilnikovia cinnamomea]